MSLQVYETTEGKYNQRKKDIILNTCKCAVKLSPMDSGVYANVVHNLGLKLKRLSAFVLFLLHAQHNNKTAFI